MLTSQQTDQVDHHARKLDKEDEDTYLDFLEKTLEEERKYITDEDIRRAEEIHNLILDEKEKRRSAFTLAVLYIKSGKEALVWKGIHTLEDILKSKENIFDNDVTSIDSSTHYKRDYLKAETAIHNLLTFDPENEQGKRLQELIKRKKKGMEKDGILGLAVAGGLSLAVGGLLGLGVLALGLVKSRR